MMVTTGGRGDQLGVGVGGALQADFDVGFRDAAGTMAEFLHHQFGGVGVQRLGDGRHHAQFHQRLDHVRHAGGHAVGQFLHGDLFRQDDVAHDLHLIGAQAFQFRLTAFALALAAHRGERADVFVLALDRGLHVDAAGAAAVVALLRRDDRRLARRHAGAGPADRARSRRRLPDRAAPGRSRSVSVAGDGAGVPAVAAAGAGGRLGRRRLLPVRRAAARGGAGVAGAAAGSAAPAAVGGMSAAAALRRRCLALSLALAAACFLGLATRFFFGGLARLVLAAARFLGGGQDRDLLLLAAFGVALGGVALLLDQRALAGGLFGRRSARGRHPARGRAGGRGATRAVIAHGRRRRMARPRRAEALGDRRALLAHLHLHDLRPAMAEALPYGARIDGPPQFQRPAGRRESRPLPPS